MYLEVLGGDERDDYPIRDQVVAVTDNQALTLRLIGAINAYLEQTPYPRYLAHRPRGRILQRGFFNLVKYPEREDEDFEDDDLGWWYCIAGSAFAGRSVWVSVGRSKDHTLVQTLSDRLEALLQDE